MTLDPRVASALDGVRRANELAEDIGRRAALCSLDIISNDISTLRVELSVAAGKLAQVVDENGGAS